MNEEQFAELMSRLNAVAGVLAMVLVFNGLILIRLYCWSKGPK